jgi:hypothetical protein
MLERHYQNAYVTPDIDRDRGDAPMGPKAPKSTVLTPAEEAIVVVFP